MLRRDLLDHGVKGTQEGVATNHKVGLRRESLEDAGELDSDVAGTNEDNFGGLALKLEESVGGNTVFGAGDVSGDDGVAAYALVVNIRDIRLRK